jgi:hypothetical protein
MGLTIRGTLVLKQSSQTANANHTGFHHPSIAPSLNRRHITMSNIDYLFDDAPFPLTSQSIKHCRSCWRKEMHRQIPISPFVLGFLTVLTLGVIHFVRPSSCMCCGKTKVL